MAGGYSFTFGTLNTLFRYDPAAESGTTMTPEPTPQIMQSAVYYPPTNKLYVFGGSDPVAGVVTNQSWIYDIATDTWSNGPNMPEMRAFMASGYNPGNNKIYLVGGYSTGNVSPAHDQTGNSIRARARTPRGRRIRTLGGGASGVIDGLLYTAGGRDASNTTLNTTYDYDIAANAWTQKANMPAADNVPGSAVYQGELLGNRRWRIRSAEATELPLRFGLAGQPGYDQPGRDLRSGRE